MYPGACQTSLCYERERGKPTWCRRTSRDAFVFQMVVFHHQHVTNQAAALSSADSFVRSFSLTKQSTFYAGGMAAVIVKAVVPGWLSHPRRVSFRDRSLVSASPTAADPHLPRR